MTQRSRRPAPLFSLFAILAAMAGLAVAGCSRSGANTADSSLASTPQSTQQAENEATASSADYGNVAPSNVGAAQSAGAVGGAPATNGGTAAQ